MSKCMCLHVVCMSLWIYPGLAARPLQVPLVTLLLFPHAFLYTSIFLSLGCALL